MFNIRNIGKTLNDEVAFRKFKLITEDVQGKNCLTNFHGMDLTRDKMCSMVKKWQTVIEAHVDLHGEGGSSGKATGDETGAKVERADGYEPPVQESV
ncbi:hypothetical protein E2I00_010589 [Balaenoptera physalus]|uniref:40S ribosomal protein S3a n=1 Tax=Balaenoptera physalus TaxID=9770 RepID=A0A6A1Q1U0_BALPH|nr:hypothetical protein E2I00_010589 [Balaenoptera physalus]